MAPISVLLASLVAACGDAPRSQHPLAPDANPQFQIRDAARNAGTPGFYFHSPIAPTLGSYPGTFDPARFTAVEICAWNGAACAGPLVARYAGTQIQLNMAGQHYRVDWPTSGIAPNALYRIRVLEGAKELGHADARMPRAGETPGSLTAQGIVPLGNASRLTIRYRIEVPPPNATPTVAIVAPVNEAIVAAGAAITLVGTAADVQDGDLSSQIVWRSNRMAEPIGTGASVPAALAGGRHTITASVTDAGGATSTASIQLVVGIVTVPATLNVPFGGTASLPITLTEPAPAGGLTLLVGSAVPGRVGIATAAVTIPAGAQSASATVQGAGPGVAMVTVSHVDYGAASAQVATTAQLHIVQPSVSFAQGRSEPITIQLQSLGQNTAAPEGGVTVTLTSAQPGCAAVTSPVTIPAGLVSATATIAHGGSAAAPCNTTVTASVAGIPEIATDDVAVSIAAAPVITLGGSTRVGAGMRASPASISLGAPAPAGGVTVTLTSADPGRLLVSDNGATSVGAPSVTLHLAAGSSGTTYHAHGVEGQAGTVAITATAPGYAAGSTASTVVGLAVEIIDLDATATSLAGDDVFRVRVGPIDVAGTGIFTTQELRPAGTPIVVTLTNANAAVAALVTSAGTAQLRTVTIPVGQNSSPSTVATGGIALDPIGGGTTTVTATSPGITALGTATRTVTVTASAISVGGSGMRVGAGLRAGTSSVSLDAGAPTGGVTVTLTSADPSRLLVSDGDSGSVGAASVTLAIPAGSTAAAYRVHGVEGQSGSVTVTATAPSYTSGSATATVVPVAIDLLDLNGTTTSLSANIVFRVRLGAVNASGTGFHATQEVRPGGTPIPITITNGNAAAAQLVTSTGAAQTRTVAVPLEASTSPSSVAGGGIALDPIGAGTTTVTASGSGVVALAGATQTMTVTAPRITLSSSVGRVGAGLRSGQSSVSLDAPAPAGGLTVTLTSADPSRLLVSDNNIASMGAASVSLTIPAGSTVAGFFGHALEGQTGTVAVTATAPGYTAGSASMTVVPSGIEILNVPTTTTTLSTNTAFLARVGPMPATGASLFSVQDVRPGGTPIVVTVTNGNAAVGQLVTGPGAAQTRTTTIPAGQSVSPPTVAAGGIAFDPIGSGSTTLMASAPGLVSSTEATRTVTVSAPAITIGLGSPTVGAGLRTTQQSISLGAPAPAGGLAVTLTSSSPGVLLVSDNGATSVGTGTVSLTIAAGATVVGFYTHGVEGQTGTATLTASAPGFTNGTGSVTVRGVGLRVINLPGTTSAGSANTLFRAQVGVLNGAGTDLFTTQDVRPGGTPIVVTVTNGNAAVAQLMTGAGAGQARTVIIPTGQDASPSSVAAGGVAFDPIAAGSTTVTVTAPGIAAIASATQGVTVTP